MNVHYESQCLPTPLAWHAHRLPPWFQVGDGLCFLLFSSQPTFFPKQALSVVSVYFIEGLLPFLFFVPFRRVRLAAGGMQVVLMVRILRRFFTKPRTPRNSTAQPATNNFDPPIQILIMLTGNYNFFNMLTSLLAISLVEDSGEARSAAAGS